MTATGDVQVLEFGISANRQRFMLMHTPADETTDPVRLTAPSDYLAALSTSAPRNTQKARAYDLALWFGWCLQHGDDWQDADARMIAEFVTALQTTPAGQPLGLDSKVLQLIGQTTRSPASVRRVAQSLRAFYAWAGENEMVSRRAVKRVGAFKAPKARTVVQADRLQPEQVAQLLKTVRDNPRDHFLIRVMYGCGLRISQALSLQFIDLHFEPDNQLLHNCSIPGAHVHVVARSEEELPSGVAHKTGRSHWVPVDHHVTSAYSDWLVARMEALGEEDPSPFVFVSLHGESAGSAWTMGAAQKRMQRLAGELDFDQSFHAHLLRHTFASELADLGVSQLTLQTLLGHSHPNSTAVYMHPLAEEMVAAVSRLSAHREERLS